MGRKLNFDGTSKDVRSRNLDVGNRTVSIDPKIDIESMGELGLPSYAYKLLPIARIADEYVEGDRAMRKPIVIPKGKIVSLLTDQTEVEDGISEPEASGDIPVYEDQSGAIVQKSIDDSYWGYGESIQSLLVPANGGNQSTHEYTSLDDEFGAWTSSSDDDLIITPNFPAGIVYHDVYLDIRGAKLNYELQDAVGVAHKGFIDIPFIDTSLGLPFGSDDSIGDPGNDIYDALYRKYAFFYFDGDASEGISGSLVKSDRYGNYVVESADATSAARSGQTVGKLLSTDSRFPKSLQDEIHSYPGLKTPNAETKGLPTDLYMFVKEALEAAGADATAGDILDAVQNGNFGYARIELDV